MLRYALVGKDVRLSASPAMMNAAFGYLGISAEYFAVSIKEEEFDSFMMNILESYQGINVTMPFKSRAIGFVDQLDEAASIIKCINTIKCENKVYGYNTDVYGILEPLRQRRARIRCAALLGTGGAARAFCLAMNMINCREIHVWDRSKEAASKFADSFGKIFPRINFHVINSDMKTISYDLLFNATPMGSNGIPLLEDAKQIAARAEILFDSAYSPYETELLKTGSRVERKIIRGYEMLLYQGAAAFRIWSGRDPPLRVMKDALLGFLGRMR